MPMIQDRFVKGLVKDNIIGFVIYIYICMYGLNCVCSEPSLHLLVCTTSTQHLQLSSCPVRPAAKQASQLVDLCENEETDDKN